jgi:hypothetical protein
MENSYKNKNIINKPQEVSELPKSKAHIIIEIVEYVPNAVVSKTIIKKTTGNVTACRLMKVKSWRKNHTIRYLRADHSRNGTRYHQQSGS